MTLETVRLTTVKGTKADGAADGGVVSVVVDLQVGSVEKVYRTRDTTGGKAVGHSCAGQMSLIDQLLFHWK